MSSRSPRDPDDRSTTDDQPPTNDALTWLRHDVARVRELLRHDAREPLHVLSLYGRLLADNPDTATFGRPIVDAAAEVRDLFVTIETWLALGPPNAGPAHPVALAATAANRPGVQLDLPPAELPVAMRPRHLRHAFDQLLDLSLAPDDPDVRITIDEVPDDDVIRITLHCVHPIQVDDTATAIPQRLVASTGGTLIRRDGNTGWTVLLPRA